MSFFAVSCQTHSEPRPLRSRAPHSPSVHWLLQISCGNSFLTVSFHITTSICHSLASSSMASVTRSLRVAAIRRPFQFGQPSAALSTRAFPQSWCKTSRSSSLYTTVKPTQTASFKTMASLKSSEASPPTGDKAYDPEIVDMAKYIHNYKIDSELAVSLPYSSSSSIRHLEHALTLHFPLSTV